MRSKCWMHERVSRRQDCHMALSLSVCLCSTWEHTYCLHTTHTGCYRKHVKERIAFLFFGRGELERGGGGGGGGGESGRDCHPQLTMYIVAVGHQHTWELIVYFFSSFNCNWALFNIHSFGDATFFRGETFMFYQMSTAFCQI